MLYNQVDSISALIESWTKLAEQIEKRMPNWYLLQQLLIFAKGLDSVEVLDAQKEIIEIQRQLLQEPDPVPTLLSCITQLLRDELNKLDHEYAESHKMGMARLESDPNWQRLEPEQRHSFLSKNTLLERARPVVNVQSASDVLVTLNKTSLDAFRDKLAAMSSRFDAAARSASETFEPQAQTIRVPYRTIKTEVELDDWLEETKTQLSEALKKGPIVIR
jgi:hypothetical protein